MRHSLFTGAALAVLFIATPALSAQPAVWVIDGQTEKPYFTHLQETLNAKSGPRTTARVVSVPNINEAIQAASVSRGLPDVIMVGGPNMASMAWAGTLQPIGSLLEPAVLSDLFLAVKEQGIYGPTGFFYQISSYEWSVFLRRNKSYLKKAGARFSASVKDPWSREEMPDALKKLAALPEVTWPLDMKLNYGAGERMTYGFAPFAWPSGGNLIDRTT